MDKRLLSLYIITMYYYATIGLKSLFYTAHDSVSVSSTIYDVRILFNLNYIYQLLVRGVCMCLVVVFFIRFIALSHSDSLRQIQSTFSILCIRLNGATP